MDWRLRRSKVLAILFQNFILVFVTMDKSNNVVRPNRYNFTKKMYSFFEKKGKIHSVQSSCSHFGLFAQKLLLKSAVMLWGKEGSTLVASTCLSPIRVSRRFWSRPKGQELQIESLFWNSHTFLLHFRSIQCYRLYFFNWIFWSIKIAENW